MTIIAASKYGETPFQKLLGHNKGVMNSWSVLGDVLEKDGLLPAALKEQVRRVLAQTNGCEYCKAKGKPNPGLYDEKMSIAVGFAEVFLKYKKENIPDFAYNLLKETFNEAEISELLAFMCFTTAQQYFGAIMRLSANQ